MTFSWQTPPWQRFEDCTHVAVTLMHEGDGKIATSGTSLRGDNATEALADLLMGDSASSAAIALPGFLGVLVLRGIDIMWLAQPPITTSLSESGELTLSVHGTDEQDLTLFSADQTRDLYSRLQAAYGSR